MVVGCLSCHWVSVLCQGVSRVSVSLFLRSQLLTAVLTSLAAPAPASRFPQTNCTRVNLTVDVLYAWVDPRIAVAGAS